ncbi:TolC family outer membrane protein [Methylomonas rivi]|uniref:TolC family outer membrane protein n=1 Tax=Methylomonas rivi TaxID=2952226 RepID=A0ABT1U812_9GAMM|nr:TolC family outer membrane protein [Methylomonas sp. WSC-6]MCQ8129984.1 TolC family outer membrane protein [Methylomonas sp. WSC-6]
MRAFKLPLIACWLGLATQTQAADLLELYDQALLTHPIVKGSEFAIDQAKARHDQARSKLLPQISAVGNLNWNELSQALPNNSLSSQSSATSSYQGTRGVVQLRQALFDLSSFLRWQGAESITLQTEQELEVAKISMTANLIDQYLEVLETEDQINYLQSEKSHTESDLKRMQRMQAMQLVPVTDLYDIEAYYQTLLTTELETIGARDIGLAKLNETTGVVVTALLKLNADSIPPVNSELEQWVEQGAQQHPSLLALNHAVDGAQKEIDGAKADHLPTLSMQMSQVYADNGGFDNRQLPYYNVGSIGLQVNVPIYAGGGTEASVDEATARYHQTQEKRTAKLREIDKEIRTAFVQARTGRARIDSTTKEVEAREKARDGKIKSYELGVINIVDLLEAKKNLLKTQFQHAQSRYDFIRSVVALKLWSGNLHRQDVEEINNWLVR